MANYSIFPEKDTTLYSHPDRKEMNYGGDEILELLKERGSTDNILYPSRILMKFKNEDITTAFDLINPPGTMTVTHELNGSRGYSFLLPTQYTASLNLTSAEPTNLTSVQNINIYALSQSWDEGTGRYSNLPASSDGANWIYNTGDITGTKWPTSSFGGAQATGSINSNLITKGGGTWYVNAGGDAAYTGFEYSQHFLAGDSLDTNIDITQLVNKWRFNIGGALKEDSTAIAVGYNQLPYIVENNGIIIKLPETVETIVSHSLGNLQYFSLDTHTIHPPKLTFKWDDSITHTSQSALNPKIIISGSLAVSLYRNKEEYNQNGVATFRIHVRDKYPTRTFSTTSNNLGVGYFTTRSLYSIRDAHTEQEIVPFDIGSTKLSSDAEGMFCKIYMKGLQPERYYRLLFKDTNDEGTTVYDNDYYFKVVR